MKSSLITLIVTWLLVPGFLSAGLKGNPMSFYDFEVKSLMGESLKLDQYRGKTSLVVNVASKCGYTPQYKGLQALYEKYKDKGLVVLGFPSNDFGAQEPGSAEEIKEFCDLNYGVSFPLFQKNPVKGSDRQAVYDFLVKNSEPVGQEVAWNFEKFLVGPDGKVVARFKSAVDPLDAQITSKIESTLK